MIMENEPIIIMIMYSSNQGDVCNLIQGWQLLANIGLKVK